jgi:hypothetical protein
MRSMRWRNASIFWGRMGALALIEKAPAFFGRRVARRSLGAALVFSRALPVQANHRQDGL